MNTSEKKNFEDFLAKDGKDDICRKIDELNDYLDENPQAYLDGLGLQLLEAAKAQTMIRDDNQTEHPVIMMGSNSFLSLTTHPRVMVDDAHGIGVVGPNGRGTAEVFGCQDKVDFAFGALSKALGAIGGYCAGSSRLIRYLRYYARTYFFSTSLPAPVIAGLIEVFNIIEEDKVMRNQLWENIGFMRKGLAQRGFNTGNSESAIIPVIVNDEEKLAHFHNELRHRGVFTNLVSYPAVRRKECRLRINIMRTHTVSELEQALKIMAETGKKYGIIQ